MSEIALAYPAFVRKFFNRSGDPSKDFTHAILGIATEIHEYLSATDGVNGLEELGDLEFYVEALRQVCDEYSGAPILIRDAHGVFVVGEYDIPAAIAGSVNELLDHAKRWVGYNTVPDIRFVMQYTYSLVEFVNVTGPYPCDDHDRIKAANMAKLLKRYPEGEFNQFRALTRDLDGERAVLAAH